MLNSGLISLLFSLRKFTSQLWMSSSLWLDKAFKCAVVNLTCDTKNGGSPKIALNVPFKIKLLRVPSINPNSTSYMDNTYHPHRLTKV